MKDNDRAALVALKQRLRERFGQVELTVFGSKARGEDVPDSDIDVLIVLESVTAGTEAEIDDLIYDIDLAYDCVISAMVFSRSELSEGPLRQSPLLRAIAREGVAV
ncbi:MAG: nucleotidyltransferase domain-containing protein [Candidatus Methylomirabilales bacterium]